MDNAKIGRLISQLRKEKGLTQQNIADSLNISNKTVSKWECGLGCPEISLWAELSTILGADIKKLLEGELNPNQLDIGKIERTRFYVCPTCGNILISTGKADISCCGRRLYPLTLKTSFHEVDLKIEELDIDYYITFNHEMSKSHYISFVAYVNNDSVLLNRLYPEQDAAVRIPVLRSNGKLYVYCNQHGLQVYEKCFR